MTLTNLEVQALTTRLRDGGTVSDAELEALLRATDILTLAMAADDVRRARHGQTVTYVRVADVAFAETADLSAIIGAAGEVRLSGPYDRSAVGSADLRRVVEAAGTTPVSAFSLEELEQAAQGDPQALADICRAMRDSGVAAVADAPLDRLASPAAAFDAAAAAGLGVARVTVGAHSDPAGRVAWLRRLEQVCAAGHDLHAVAPLARAWNAASPSTGYDDVRMVAVTRLFASRVSSVQVDWSLYGPKLAQVALTMGGSDLDGVTASDDAPDGRRRAPLEDVLRNIRAAGCTPQERDGLHRPMGV